MLNHSRTCLRLPVRLLTAVTFCLLLLPVLQWNPAGSALVAQSDPPDQPTRLMEMLKLVPNIPDYPFTTVAYSDLEAAEQARPSTAGIKNWPDFEALQEADDPKAALWINSMPPSGFADILNYMLVAGPELPAVMGFDFFSIDRAVTFGNPPGHGTILDGSFDADAIDAALATQGFVRDEVAGFPRWCSSEGCDAGYQTNIRDRNPANLFGGNLGRKQPEVLADDRYLFTAPDAGVAQAITDAYTGSVRSMAENPYFRAADAALSAKPDALLRQAYFFNPMMFTPFRVSPDLLTAPDGQATLDAMQAGLRSLPDYGLLVVADLADAEAQYAVIVLVYGREQDAQTALEVIPARLEVATSFLMRQSIQTILDSREMTLLPPAVVTSPDAKPGSERYAATFVFRYPLPPEPTESSDDLTGIVQTGLGYRLFLDFLFRQDTLWLAGDLAMP